jgi:hypothetical protein
LTYVVAENLLEDEGEKEPRIDFLLGQLKSKGSSQGGLLAKMVLAQAVSHSPDTERAALAFRVLDTTAWDFGVMDDIVQPETVSSDLMSPPSLCFLDLMRMW